MTLLSVFFCCEVIPGGTLLAATKRAIPFPVEHNLIVEEVRLLRIKIPQHIIMSRRSNLKFQCILSYRHVLHTIKACGLMQV